MHKIQLRFKVMTACESISIWNMQSYFFSSLEQHISSRNCPLVNPQYTFVMRSFTGLAILSIASAAVPTGTSQNQYSDLTGAQNSMINHQQVQDTLNNQLKGDGNVHANADRLVAYITGADSQIDNAIATVSKALAPLTGGLSEAVGNVLLGPFVQSVTNGAEVFVANLVGGTEDRLDAEMVGQLTGDYSRLAELSSKNNVDVSKLQNLNQQIQNTLPKSKN